MLNENFKMSDIAIEPLEKNELGKLKGGFSSFSVPEGVDLYNTVSVENSVTVTRNCGCSCGCTCS